MSAPSSPGDEDAAAPPAAEGQGVDKYKKRALLGGLALAARTGLAQLIILGGTVVLARRLLPAEFGAFAMIQFALAALTVFGDAGLAGALVQRKAPPTQRELSSVFFAQLGLGAIVFVLASLLGELLPWIWPDLPEGSPWILRALAFSFVLTSSRVVSMLLLERELQFVRVSILDTINSVVFYLVASSSRW
jgi:PST family polysaccharide transporter